MQPIFEANTYLGCIFAFKGTKFSTNQQMFGGIIKSPSPNEQFEQFFEFILKLCLLHRC